MVILLNVLGNCLSVATGSTQVGLLLHRHAVLMGVKWYLRGCGFAFP